MPPRLAFDPMSGRSNRRRFFRELLRESAGLVREVNSALRADPDSAEADIAGTPERGDWSPSGLLPGGPTTVVVRLDDLVELCRDVGLDDRSEDVQRLVRSSVRITRTKRSGDEGGFSRLGGAPHVPSDFIWPTHRGNALAFLAQIDLGDVARLTSAPLPEDGLLSFFFERSVQGSLDALGCHVALFDHPRHELSLAPDQSASFSEYPVELSLELTLPKSWSLPVESLNLNHEELELWDELRTRLARAQGVEPEELTPDWHSVHRLLGYPEELGAEMEIDLELGALGLDATYADVDADDAGLRERAMDWRLLLQVSDDGTIRVSDEPTFERVYFWIRAGDLAALNLGEASALVR